MKNLRFTGRRIEAPMSPVFKGRHALHIVCALYLKLFYIKDWFKQIFPIFLT